MQDYRKKYKEYYGIEFGKEYAVHHIDQNRENNDICNLVLIPAKLHSKYHFLKIMVEAEPLCTTITGSAMNAQTYKINCIKEFIDTLDECNKWYDYKLFLDNKIPNIHGIILE